MADNSGKRQVSNEEMELRRKLVIACRALGMQGSIALYGHVSIRVADSDIVLITPGAGAEKTTVRIDEIFVFNLAGDILYHPGGDRPLQIPAEWRIHTQIHRDRPEILCVAHLHAHASTLMGICGREIVPVFAQGACCAGGIPTWDNPRLVVTDEMAADLSRTLGGHISVQMRGHGSVVVGESVESVLGACTFIEENARYQIEAEPMGGVKPFPEGIWEELAGRTRRQWGGASFWKYWEQKVLATGIPLT